MEGVCLVGPVVHDSRGKRIRGVLCYELPGFSSKKAAMIGGYKEVALIPRAHQHPFSLSIRNCSPLIKTISHPVQMFWFQRSRSLTHCVSHS